jgi:hypothetical protein
MMTVAAPFIVRETVAIETLAARAMVRISPKMYSKIHVRSFLNLSIEKRLDKPI